MYRRCESPRPPHILRRLHATGHPRVTRYRDGRPKVASSRGVDGETSANSAIIACEKDGSACEAFCPPQSTPKVVSSHGGSPDPEAAAIRSEAPSSRGVDVNSSDNAAISACDKGGSLGESSCPPLARTLQTLNRVDVDCLMEWTIILKSPNC